MPVKVVLDYPERYRARRLRRSITTLARRLDGVGRPDASIGLFPSFVYIVGIVMDEPKMLPTLLDPLAMTLDMFGVDVSTWPQTLPRWNADLLLAAAVSITITVAGLTVGLRLLRGNRELVLFLRRFGYGAATSVATFAAAKTIGQSWRLVTLDDACGRASGDADGHETPGGGRSASSRQGFMVAGRCWWGLHRDVHPCCAVR